MRSERQRIYECVMDWPDVSQVRGEFADAECRIAASALIEAKRLNGKASEAHAVILRRASMMRGKDQAIAAGMVANGGRWWLDLIAECEQ